MNLQRAARLVEVLAAAGVGEWCLCPGGRNSPLVLVLQRAAGLRTRQFFEERSAAFFGVGRIKATGTPVAVVTTSGTAAAELLPAAIEAYYSGLPLVLVTADRPPAYRGTGAPQTIEQPGLFGVYAPTVYDGRDADDDRVLAGWRGDHPVHLNISFDEPLVDGEVPALRARPDVRHCPVPPADPAPLVHFLKRTRRPLVLLGPLEPPDRDLVREFLLRYGAPVYAEPLSGLREDPALASLTLRSGEGVLSTLDPDGVLRIGGVPTVRYWRDLERRPPGLPVCGVARTPFPGLTDAAIVRGNPGEVLSTLSPDAVASAVPAVTERWLAHDRRRAGELVGLLEGEPRAEPALVRALSALVPPDALVYLGNSLPIREWDLAAGRDPRQWRVAGNRGANGIDGQLSTFFGMCEPGREHWAVIGDLTALYDLAAPWALRGLETGPLRIVIVNNGGGQIFARLSPHAVLRNEHDVAFADWARMWGLAYHRWESVPAERPAATRCVIELRPDPEATARFWGAYDALASRP